MARPLQVEFEWAVYQLAGHVRVWLRIELGGESLRAIAREQGYPERSAIHRVIARVEENAK